MHADDNSDDDDWSEPSTADEQSDGGEEEQEAGPMQESEHTSEHGSEHFAGSDEFLARVREIVSTQCEEYEQIDDTLRTFLGAIASFHDDFKDREGASDEPDDEDHVQSGCFELLDADLFKQHRQYIRRQFIESLLEEDDYATLQVLTTALLYDGRSDEETFIMMQDEGLFSRLIFLVKKGNYEDTIVHRLLLELLCEMTRIRQIERDDLVVADDTLFLYLFQLIERMSIDPTEPYHYAIMRLLLILNEQFMCFSQGGEAGEAASDPVPNRIIKILSSYGPAYRSFGENLIMLLNRQSELGPQLLILKMLYLLFTNTPTYEYFYTNDLHVLVDVIMRNLLDLDPIIDEDDDPSLGSESLGQRALRHTYLRVFYPLLNNTQLSRPDSHYKRDEVRRILGMLAYSSSQHFAPAEVTFVRLVTRCLQIDWLSDEADEFSEPLSRSAPTDGDVAKKILGMSHVEAGISTLSVLDVTAKVEEEEKKQPRPVIPPRRRKGGRRPGSELGETASEAFKIKIKPMLPKPRRARADQSRDKSPFADQKA